MGHAGGGWRDRENDKGGELRRAGVLESGVVVPGKQSFREDELVVCARSPLSKSSRIPTPSCTTTSTELLAGHEAVS
jgi:hypothetical protein